MTPRLPLAAVTGVLGAVLGFAPAASAQTVTGRVVDSASHRPLARVAVRLVPAADSGWDTVYATGESAADGVFLLAAPAPGRYRVRLGTTHLSPPLTLATADAMDAHEYLMSPPDSAAAASPAASRAAPPAAPDDGDRVYSERETQPHARMLRGAPMPEPSAFMVDRAARTLGGAKWRATIECVVDVVGRCEPGSVRLVSATDGDYGAMMRDYVAGAAFTPARVGGQVVRQRVQVPFTVGVRVEVRRLP